MQLNLEIGAFDSLAGPYHRCRGTITTLRGGRRADFEVILHDESGEPVARGQLLAYPRWSEELAAFVARCLAKALESRPKLACNPIRIATVEVRLADALLLETSIQLRGGRAFVEGCPIEAPTLAKVAPWEPPPLWQLAAWALAYREWATCEIAPLPALVEPPVYYHGGLTYCRLSDLPWEARRHCERWLFGQAVPEVPGVLDAIFASDMARYLG